MKHDIGSVRSARAKTRRARRYPHVSVAYLRVSKEEQQLGPEAQRATIEAWAARGGVRVASWHLDQLTSVTPTEKRPGLLAALNDLQEHHAGVLIVAKRDRIARDPVLTAGIERIALDHGATLLSAAGEGNGSTPADEFMRGVIHTTARYERALIRARTRNPAPRCEEETRRAHGLVPLRVPGRSRRALGARAG